VVVTCLFYGASSGSGPATVAAVGSMTIPILVSMGYEKVFAVSLVAVAGGLGVIIPPSIPFILFGTSTGTSVGGLFIAGILPGILIGVFIMIYAWFYCKKHGEDKETINTTVDELRAKGFWALMKDSCWALFTPIIILGSIYSGIASPTEAAVFSVYYALIISLFMYRSLKPREVWGTFVAAVKGYGPIMFVLMSAFAFSKVLNLLQIPQAIQASMAATFSTKFSLLLIINLMLLIVGMIMDTSPAILILAPLFTPIVGALGVNPIHFGIIMVVNLAIGFVTPPVGVNLFVASSMTGVPMMQIAKHALPMIIMFLIALIFIAVFPAISLLLVGV
jgi:C4-dicarboxylate transporter DctM subunit